MGTWILWCSTFIIIQLSHPHTIIGKTIALTIWTFVGKKNLTHQKLRGSVSVDFIPGLNKHIFLPLYCGHYYAADIKSSWQRLRCHAGHQIKQANQIAVKWCDSFNDHLPVYTFVCFGQAEGGPSLKRRFRKTVTPILLVDPLGFRWRNRHGKSGNSGRSYFLGHQNHCRWWVQPWN